MKHWEPPEGGLEWPMPLHWAAWREWNRRLGALQATSTALLVQAVAQAGLLLTGNGHVAVAGPVIALGAVALPLVNRQRVRRAVWERALRRALRSYGPEHLPSRLVLDPDLERAGLGELVGELGPEGAEIARGLAPEHDGKVGELLELARLLAARPAH